MSGNRMTAHNLATILAPSIAYTPATAASRRAFSDNDAIVAVVETMIKRVDEIYSVPRELQYQLYTTLKETGGGEALDMVLYALHSHNMQG
jgi:hypothetical protein